MSELYDKIKVEVEAYIARTKADFANGIQLADLLSLLTRGVETIIRITQATGADNAAKKAAAMQAFTEWYDAIMPALDLPGPFDVVLKPMLRIVVMAGASLFIDKMVDLVFHPVIA